MTTFEVHDIFVLGDGKTVFAGSYSSGELTLGIYKVSVGGMDLGSISIREKMIFSSKGATDVALCTVDKVERDELDLNKAVVLTLCE